MIYRNALIFSTAFLVTLLYGAWCGATSINHPITQPDLNNLVRSNDYQGLETALKNGADTNAYDKDGLLPIHIVAQKKHIKLVKLLSDYGADVNLRTEPKLQTPLQFSIENEDINMVKELLSHGADPNLSMQHGKQPLVEAASDSEDIAKELLRYGADVNKKGLRGFYPLYHSVGLGKTDLTKHFLINGADPELCHPLYGCPIDIAILQGHYKIARLLKKHGAEETIPFNNDSDTQTENNTINLNQNTKKNSICSIVEHPLKDYEVNILTEGLEVILNKGEEEIIAWLDTGLWKKMSKLGQLELYRKGSFKSKTPEKKSVVLYNSGVSPILDCKACPNAILYFSIYFGYNRMVDIILSNRTNDEISKCVDATPFLASLHTNNVESAKIALRHNSKHVSMDEFVDNIYHISYSLDKERFQMLLDNGLDQVLVHYPHLATFLVNLSILYGNHGVLDHLFDIGLDAKKRDFNGNCALHYSIFSADTSMIHKALSHGADINCKNSSNITAHDFIMHNKISRTIPQ